MTLDEIKKISIREYLAGLNIYPAKERGYYGMYYSPFRQDQNASMKVDYNQNLWVDYGTGEGGTIIDLAMRIDHSSLNEAIAELNKYDQTTVRHVDTFSFHRNDDKNNPEKQEPAIQMTVIKELTHPALLDYLHQRCIDTGTAMQYCREIHYMVNDKPYFAVGFPNDTGGYDLRNEYFQGCLSPKDITHIKQKEPKTSCYVFEGFMDYFSFLVLRNKYNPGIPGTDKQDYIILNSTSNVAKVLDRLDGYEDILCFLDNDLPGRQAFQKIRQKFDAHVRDASKHYAKHKDLNDYLCGHFGQSPAVKPSLMKPPAIRKKRNKGRGL